MLELKNISFTLDSDKEPVTILKDVSLTLEDNKFYVITGPNGGGKSTLAKIIMGIYQPTAGKIILDGKDITELPINERAKLGIGFAFQQPPRFKGITVRELLKLARSGQKGSGCNHLYDVGLCPKDYADREVNASLSGGELKRIEIATLLNRDLKVAIFDEPEAGIDLWSFSRLTETFKEMNNKNKSTMVIISHQERILEMADEIILVSEGEIQEIGEKTEMLSQILSKCNCDLACPERGEENVKCY